MQVQKNQNQREIFQDNPNIDNVIQKLENKRYPNLPPKIEEKVRTRKFKKALNTHGARVERITMVKGLTGSDQGTRREEEKKKPPQVGEELESTMTHKEIEEFSTRYSITWQQVFQLDAEFWSLITIESEEKEVKKDMDLPDPSYMGEEEEPQEKKMGVDADGPSISLKIFLDFTTSLGDKFKDVNKRLI